MLCGLARQAIICFYINSSSEESAMKPDDRNFRAHYFWNFIFWSSVFMLMSCAFLWKVTEHNIFLLGSLSILFWMPMLDKRKYYGLRFCHVCHKDLTEGDGLIKDRPYIPVRDLRSGMIIGAACEGCSKAIRASCGGGDGSG